MVKPSKANVKKQTVTKGSHTDSQSQGQRVLRKEDGKPVGTITPLATLPLLGTDQLNQIITQFHERAWGVHGVV